MLDIKRYTICELFTEYVASLEIYNINLEFFKCQLLEKYFLQIDEKLSDLAICVKIF